jgi:hypothetical protein
MNAVTTVEEKPKKPAVQSGGRIAAMIPTDIDQAYRMAQALAGSQMTPKAFANDPNKILVGIIAGMEVGLAPFQALQSIAVINGNPSLWGDGALALIQGSGLLLDIEETDDGETATCRLVRKDRETPIVRSFSNAMAKQAGLLGKAGPWTQYQARMRQMRARSWAMRDGFPDVLKGIGIAEEVRDFPVAEEVEVAPRMTRQILASHSEPQPEIQDAEVEEVEQGRADEEHGDQNDGDETDDTPAWAGMVADWKERIANADVVGTIIAIRGELKPHVEVLPTEVAHELYGLLDAAASRFTTKGE